MRSRSEPRPSRRERARLVRRALFVLGPAVLAASSSPGHAQARLAPPVRDSGAIGFDDEGLRIHSHDGRRQLKLRGYVSADARFVLSDTADAPANTFAIRRSRIFLDANVNPWLAFRLLFDIAAPAGPSPIADAFVDVGLGRAWWLRAGKMKTPVGLERYTSISAQLLPERSIASNLNASRDEGLLLTGTFGEGVADLSVGVFNGAPDGGAVQDADANDAKDWVYRLWLHPVRRKVGGVEQGIGVALNGSAGIARGSTSAGSQLPTFRTPAQVSYFSYGEAAGVRASGWHTRQELFGYAYSGSWAASAEWMGTSQEVARGATTGRVPMRGWLVSAQRVLTGEASALEGIAPERPFDPANGHWGALQVGMRAARVSVGGEAFPDFADPTVAAREATELGVALSWYVTRATKAQLAYEHTVFTGGAPFGDRRAERYVQLRWQAYF